MPRLHAIAAIVFCAASLTATGTRAAQDADKDKKKGGDLGALFRFHYDNRVRSFREQNLVFRNVVLLGDSITEGFDVAESFPGRRVLNRGIGGDVIGVGLPDEERRGVLRRLDCSVFDCAATDVFLMIGVNDLSGDSSLDALEGGYREILRQIKEKVPGVRVHVESLLPTRGAYARHNAKVRDFNRRLRRLASESGYRFLDLHPLFADKDGELKAEFTKDGLHLTGAGYEVWRAEVEKAMGWRPVPK